MKLIPPLFGLSRILLWLIFLFLGWQLWVFFRPGPRKYTPGEVKAVRSVCRHLRDHLDSQLEGTVRVGVAHLVNDPSDTATGILKQVLAEQNDWTVESGSVIQKFLGDVSQTLAGATSLDEIINAARRVELDVVVTGRIISVRESGGRASCESAFYVCDVRTGEWLINGPLRAEWSPGLVEKSTSLTHRTNPLTRILVWLGFVLILPWISAPVVRWVLEKKSNTASFLLLLTYSVLALILAFALTGFHVTGAGGCLMIVAAAVIAAGYSWWVCEFIGDH